VIHLQLFKRLRAERGLSQEKLASAADVSQQLIGEIERGKVRSTKAIYRIARVLGTSAHVLDPEIHAVDGLLAKIEPDLRKIDEEEALVLLENLQKSVDFAMQRKSRINSE
jgi:transcriptional regulator with XRE-family HTH domain